jgi:predicted nucleotidyltransferase
MIPKKELDKAINIAKEFGIGKLYLFGSSLYKSPMKANDYDFAVAGISPSNFFSFYGKLMMSLSKNVDLIDVTERKGKFIDLILKEGKVVYDKGSN